MFEINSNETASPQGPAIGNLLCCRSGPVAVHLSVRSLLVLIELFLLAFVQDLADLFVGLLAPGPHLGQALIARQGFVQDELQRGVMQFLEARCDSSLLTALS